MKIIKKIITALGNPILNNELRKSEEFNILINDIQYQEAIIEFLSTRKDVDYIILSELLPGILSIEELINEIKIKNQKIEIIIILEKENQNLEQFLKNKSINHIFYNNKVEIKDIIKILKNKNFNNNENIEKEIEYLKNIILNKNIKKYKKLINKNIKEKNKMICILGESGVGKSIFSVIFSNYLKKLNKKILIIDFDILNNSIHTILGSKKYSNYIKEKLIENNLDSINNVQNLILKINKNIEILTGIDLLFNLKEKIDKNKLIKIINLLKNNYDYIIIDTSSECFFENNKILIENSDFSIFILESNLLEITKANKLLEIYTKKWGIKKNKIKILINKYNINSIDENIVKSIFSEYEVIGKIKMSKLYNKIINKNNNLINKNNELKLEYKKIGEKILKVNFKRNKYYLKNIINSILYRIKVKC